MKNEKLKWEKIKTTNSKTKEPEFKKSDLLSPNLSN